MRDEGGRRGAAERSESGLECQSRFAFPDCPSTGRFPYCWGESCTVAPLPAARRLPWRSLRRGWRTPLSAMRGTMLARRLVISCAFVGGDQGKQW
jgi:hypothetical protein